MGTWNETKWPKMGRAGPISEYLTDHKMVVLCIHELFSTCYRQALGSSLFSAKWVDHGKEAYRGDGCELGGDGGSFGG
jgi:hypothetical protein